MSTKARFVVTLGVLALVLGACGGDDATDGSVPVSGADGGGDATAASCTLGQTDGNISLYNWSDYIDPELLTKFTEETGVEVTEAFYDSNEAMIAQLQAGVTYDVIVPSDYMVGIMIQEEMLNPMNDAAVPNLANLGERFTQLAYDPGPEYSAAYLYGTTGLGVNKTIVGEDFPHSWALIFDPALTTTFAGGVSVLNDPREAMGAALEYLGYSLNDTDLAHLQEAADTITAAKEGITTFDSDQYSESLANGEVAVSQGYSGNMLTDISNAANPDDFEYILPEEGATLWIDNMVVPVSAEHPCSAFTFVNFMLDPENGAALANYIAYGSPNAAAAEFMDPEIVEFYAATEESDVEVIEDTGDYEINFTDYFAMAKG